jgi:AraC family transcriptional regulator, arabinose operon regulatory protein
MTSSSILQAGTLDVRLASKPTYWHCEPGWEWKSAPLDDHLLWYVMDGVGRMRLDGREWELGPGSGFIFRPGSQPHGMQDPDRRLVVFGMHFQLIDRLGRVMPDTGGMLPPPGHIVRDMTLFATLAQRCYISWRRGDELGELQSRLYLQAMVLHLWDEALHPAPSAVDLALDEIMRAIQMEPGKRRTVDELAAKAHLSRAQFVRRFRAASGLAPARFMVQARLERARRLIVETDMTLSQIAQVLGYDDVPFFSRQFKQYAGHPPSVLRKRKAIGEGAQI